MGTPSAVSPCCVNSRHLRALGLGLLPAAAALAQLSTGTIEGTVPNAGAPVFITGPAGFHAIVQANASGRFSITLPYGRYGVAGETVVVSPLANTRLDVRARQYPESFSLTGMILSREPSIVTEPLDFTGLNDNRLAVTSQRGLSWTYTQYKLNGMDATDSYQPGRPVLLPDVEALDEVVRRGTEIGVFVAGPEASWHGALSSANTGAALSWTNLPPPGSRGMVQQADQFHWFTRDRVEIGGPLTRWADLYASGAGQWSSQTQPLSMPGIGQRSRLLFGNARGRVRAGPRDIFDALYSGSRIDLSGGGVPAGIEAWTANRLAPSFVLPGGFPGAAELDHLDFVQVGWTHLGSAGSALGTIEFRYGYSVAHLDTNTDPGGSSGIELLGGIVTGTAPLGNLAVRPRHAIESAWQPAVTRQRIVAGGSVKMSAPRNRFTTPAGGDLVTAAGAPAFVMRFNTPVDSRERVRSLSAYIADHVNLTSTLSLDVGVEADFSRGSLAAGRDLVVWNNLSPRAGFAWRFLRAGYSRSYTALAGRYLDFGDPASLGGSVYQPGSGTLLLRFGGPYSSISPALRRPYADEFDIGTEYSWGPRSIARIRLFRRDDKSRIAAIDTGVPPQAFTPVSVPDQDQQLTAYAQNPTTLGQDRYLLTNPAGLRTLDAGVLAEAGTHWRRLALHASFVAEKSYGPANPGDAVYENDPGVVGALLLDPNTAVNATGRSFVDRAYVGKLQATYRLPTAWGGIEFASVADYLDGLAFARRVLVTGLPQGPFLVAATVRGSPGGGNRAEHVTNWNLRLSRQFALPFGRMEVSADILNVTNAAHRLQEDDLSGPAFSLRLPVAIQPSRFVRLGFRYEF